LHKDVDANTFAAHIDAMCIVNILAFDYMCDMIKNSSG